MQFDPDIEKCIKNPMEIRKFKEPRKSEIIKCMYKFRMKSILKAFGIKEK